MDDYAKIQKQVQDEIKNYLSNYTTQNQFQLSKIPTHVHNGNDVAKINIENIIGRPYTGRINSDGTPLKVFSGWTSIKTGTGAYKITHNLGTPLYSVFINTLSGTADMSSSIPYANYFTVNTFNNAGNAADRNFNFVLINY